MMQPHRGPFETTEPACGSADAADHSAPHLAVPTIHALETSDDETVDFVLDVHMDELSGLDLHDRLMVPTVFISGHDDAPTLERIEKSRAIGYLRKPFDRATVLEAIDRAVGADSLRHADQDEGGEA